MTEDTDLEARVEAALHGGDGVPAALLAELYERYRVLRRMLDRVTRISDRFQRAERDRGLNYADHYARKVRQIEKIVRISDQYQTMLRDLNDRLQLISTRDELTSLPNRRHISERIAETVALSSRTGLPASLALADVDRFKAVNDTWGHAVGDAVLIRTANAMQSVMRPYDVCARWGGEEFLMLFPDCDADDAVRLAERVRIKVADDAGEGAQRITLSIGVTQIRADEAVDIALSRADAALYRAKALGRDRVERI